MEATLYNNKHLKAFTDGHQLPGEKIRFYLDGLTENKELMGGGALILTDRRVVFCGKRMTGTVLQDLQIDSITSKAITSVGLLALPEVTLTSHHAALKFKTSNKVDAQHFLQMLADPNMEAPAPSAPDAPIQAAPQTAGDGRKVGFFLGLGIFLLPFVFSWFTLRRGHSALARVLALGWLAFWLVAGVMGNAQPKPGEVVVEPLSPPDAQDHLIEQVMATPYYQHAEKLAIYRQLEQLDPNNPEYPLLAKEQLNELDRVRALEKVREADYQTLLLAMIAEADNTPAFDFAQCKHALVHARLFVVCGLGHGGKTFAYNAIFEQRQHPNGGWQWFAMNGRAISLLAKLPSDGRYQQGVVSQDFPSVDAKLIREATKMPSTSD